MKHAGAPFMAVLTLGGLFLSSEYNYLLFHTLAEIFAIVIACGIFMMAWNSRQFLDNGYLMMLGVGWLSVAVLDLAHALAYKGMRIFPEDDANVATQLWIAARFVESGTVLFAPLVLRRPVKPNLLFLGSAGITLALLLSIFVWKVFPNCYIEGTGLTPFKKASEYVICFVLLGAIALLLKQRQAFDRQILVWLVWALGLTIASELCFTLYVDVYGICNLLGHFLKIVSFYFLYKAVIETGLTKPFTLLLRELDRANVELEERVRERTASLQEATDDLNTFVYTIAHDLRAPLRAQYGFATMLLELQGPLLSHEGRKCVDRITGAATRLDALVRDLLAYVTVSRDKPARTAVDLRTVVDQAMKNLAREIDGLGANVSAEAVHGVVSANEDSLQAAVQNLLGNALKFVAKGQRPRVRLWTEQREEWVRLWVEDNGIGIASQHIGKLFGVFQRLHREGEYAGRGIGLALVRKSVERMGGRVGVESEPGKGSRFWLELRQAE